MLRVFSPPRLGASGLLLLAVVFAVLWLAPSDRFVFLPDRAHPVAPLVSVQGGREPKDGGGIYFVDVIVRKASLFERLFPGIRDGSTLVPADQITPPGVSEAARRKADLREMTRSQTIAAAIALRALGYKVVARPSGALISDVPIGSPAQGKLEPTDVIVAVDGRPVETTADLRRLIGRHRAGDVVRLGVRDGSKLREVSIKTVRDPAGENRPVIGVLIDQAAQIKLPLRVKIDAAGVGGPSAGLAFALDMMEELGHDVDRGHRVAATGEIFLDGSVGPIGAVKQKTLGARAAGVDVFLVPAGENAREARRYAHGLRIIPVQSFRQALHALATLRQHS